MAITEKTQLVQVYSRNYANTQSGWNTEYHAENVTVPTGGVVLAAYAQFGSGLGNGYELLAGIERTATDSFTFNLKRKMGDNYYVNLKVMYDSDGATTDDI